ncbi:MAG: DUF2007 domain-containing protein [Thiobacillus sp.]|nr:DUF2007 domain-containing protein [Thiobacillus sp.]
MQRVHIAPTLIDAQLASDTLSGLGIANRILNIHAAGALGDLPFLQAQPEIWVEDDALAARAGAVLKALHSAAVTPDAACPRCGDINPGNFLSCWRCGCALPAR